MSLLTILRGGVKIASSATKSVQTTVTHKPRTGDGGKGNPVYVSRSLPAIVEKKQRQVSTAGGTEVDSTTTVTILDPTVVVNPMDVIVLPDGTSSEVINTGGVFDPGTRKLLLTEAYLQ